MNSRIRFVCRAIIHASLGLAVSDQVTNVIGEPKRLGHEESVRDDSPAGGVLMRDNLRSTAVPRSRDHLVRRGLTANLETVRGVLQRRFILPHLAMCLKNRGSAAGSLVLRPLDFGIGHARLT